MPTVETTVEPTLAPTVEPTKETPNVMSYATIAKSAPTTTPTTPTTPTTGTGTGAGAGAGAGAGVKSTAPSDYILRMNKRSADSRSHAKEIADEKAHSRTAHKRNCIEQIVRYTIATMASCNINHHGDEIIDGVKAYAIGNIKTAEHFHPDSEIGRTIFRDGKVFATCPVPLPNGKDRKGNLLPASDRYWAGFKTYQDGDTTTDDDGNIVPINTDLIGNASIKSNGLIDYNSVKTNAFPVRLLMCGPQRKPNNRTHGAEAFKAIGLITGLDQIRAFFEPLGVHVNMTPFAIHFYTDVDAYLSYQNKRIQTTAKYADKKKSRRAYTSRPRPTEMTIGSSAIIKPSRRMARRNNKTNA
jgi:hypothetical protein